MKTIKINKDILSKIDLSHLKDFYQHAPTMLHFYDFPPGQSEYKLYSYISHMVSGTTILEVGTGQGGSALAFSDNPKNKVITYDIRRLDVHDALKKENIELRIGEFMEDDSLNFEEIDIVLIDVDPHDGIKEPPMIEYLLSKNWSGLLFMDDISPVEWKDMNDMWNALPYKKYDLTHIGHWSGTGVIVIGDKFDIELD